MSTARSINKEISKRHIEEIMPQKFLVGKKESNPLNQDLHHAITSLSAKIYIKDVQFLIEFITLSLSKKVVVFDSRWSLVIGGPKSRLSHVVLAYISDQCPQVSSVFIQLYM
uniref:Uncharacterized protein n=1 Tax=Cannabis sativa TaxID=3483 RepID=A0A803NRS7_CANSA